MPDINHIIYSCSSSRTTQGVITLQELHTVKKKKNIAAVIIQERVTDDNLKKQIKNQILCTCRLFLLNRIFQYITNWSKIFEHLTTLLLQYT